MKYVPIMKMSYENDKMRDSDEHRSFYSVCASHLLIGCGGDHEELIATESNLLSAHDLQLSKELVSIEGQQGAPRIRHQTVKFRVASVSLCDSRERKSLL